MVRQAGTGGMLPALALSTAIALALVLVTVIGTDRAASNVAGIVFDGGCIGAAYVIAELLVRRRVPLVFVGSVLAAALVVMSGLVLAHGWFFDVAIERRLTLLDVTASGLVYFFSVSLPPRGWLAFLALYAAIGAGTVMLSPRLGALSNRALALLVVGIGIAMAGAGAAPKVASPLFDSAQELFLIAASPRVIPEVGTRAQALSKHLDKSARTIAVGEPMFSKVIVVVMETMTAANFVSQRESLLGKGFFARERSHLHTFERYYPNNQDSRTGMLDMLFSRLVPYEAYSDAGHAGYQHLGDETSLVDRMRALSFSSAFAVSQTELEDVVADLSWDETLRLGSGEIARARADGHLCFTPDEYEQSCEDLVLLPKVVDFVAGHERAFVYQEMIWGHASEYNEASGLSNAAYYERYLDALVDALAARGLREQTLIAITSDHGFRDKGRQRDPEVYRVPLFFYAPRLQARQDVRLTSHSDFGMLLFEVLAPASPRADDNPLVMIVGPTGQGHTFVVDQRGGTLLLWERLFGVRMLSQAGALSASPEVLLGAFQTYRARFDQGAGAAD